MPTYTVSAVNGTTPKPDGGYGAMQEISFDLSDGTQTFRDAKWFTKAATALPQVGETLEGEITEDPRWGLKFKKAFNGQGSFKGSSGGFKKDPATQRSIIRQHSQEMAIRYVMATDIQIMGIAELVKIIDWFEKDASGEQPQTLEQAVETIPLDRELVAVGQTDDIPF